MWRYTYQDELYHHGVKGMKWGIRRTAAQLGHVIKNKAKRGYQTVKRASDIRKANKRAEEAAKIARQRAKITNPKRLTTEELNARIKRLQLEKTYKDLMKDTETAKRGKNFVMDVLESSGKNLLTQVGNHYGAKALNKAIGEDVIFANNKKK